MIFCSNCGGTVRENSRFCNKCGAATGLKPTPTNAPNDAGSGSRIGNPSAGALSSKNQALFSKYKWFIFGGLAAIALGYFVYNSFIKDDPEKNAIALSDKYCKCQENKFDSLIIAKNNYLKEIKTGDQFIAKFKLDSIQMALSLSNAACIEQLNDKVIDYRKRYKKKEQKELFSETYKANCETCSETPEELKEIERKMYSATSSSSNSETSATVAQDAVSSGSYGGTTDQAVTVTPNSGTYAAESSARRYLTDELGGSGSSVTYYLYKCKSFYGMENPTAEQMENYIKDRNKNRSNVTQKIKSVTSTKDGSNINVDVVVDYYYFDKTTKKTVLVRDQNIKMVMDQYGYILSIS